MVFVYLSAKFRLKRVFEDADNRDEFFRLLQLLTGIKSYERNSVIIFDGVQKYVKAREMIKFFGGRRKNAFVVLYGHAFVGVICAVSPLNMSSIETRCRFSF